MEKFRNHNSNSETLPNYPLTNFYAVDDENSLYQELKFRKLEEKR
jgi:hypothetical protein